MDNEIAKISRNQPIGFVYYFHVGIIIYLYKIKISNHSNSIFNHKFFMDAYKFES